MPRPVAEIESEMESAKRAGEKPMGAKMRALRAELIVAQNPPPPEPDAPAETVTLGADVSVEVPPEGVVYAGSEWAFVEKALAESPVPEGIHQLKKYYQGLQAKVRIWRLARSIVAKHGEGAAWPSWGTLGLNPDTGEPEAPRATPPSAPPAVAPVTEAGMPVRSMRPSAAAILASVTGGDPRVGLKQEIAQRPEPQRTAEPAAV